MKRIVTLLLLCLFATFALADTPHASQKRVPATRHHAAHHQVQRHRAHKAAKHHTARLRRRRSS
jgi:hypothetical protein